jgi:glyoxylase-like metal-dependent hydrolase (beta-lactamase superfamily II)
VGHSQNLDGAKMMTAVIEDVPAAAGARQRPSPTNVNPTVTAFYDAPTGSVQYVVTDPNTRKCVIIDPASHAAPGKRPRSDQSNDSIFSRLV